MSTITKKLKTIEVTTVHGDTFTVADTSECPAASSTLAQFMAGGVMYFSVEDVPYYVPPNAVDHIAITSETDEDIVVPDHPCSE